LGTKAKTLHKRGFRSLNGTQKGAWRSFSTRWVLSDTDKHEVSVGVYAAHLQGRALW
jgi:hypothetical protein